MFETCAINDFSDIRALVHEEQQQAEQLILDSLYSKVSLINQIGEYIVQSGGKRLRMLLVLLTAKAFGYEGTTHIQLASIIELLHTATLLHDDVVDSSQLRRGKPTANKVWGENASVLVGDYLYSRAFQLIVQANNVEIMEILAQASNKMAEGEVMQLMNCHNPDVDEERYKQVIANKTGTLFAAAAKMGAVLTNQSAEKVEAMWHFGLCLGIAFQLVDDALDYRGSAEQMGKNMGDDLAEGKPTLPFIRAMSKLPDAKANILRSAIQQGKTENIKQIFSLIQSTDAIDYTYAMAKSQVKLAKAYLASVPPSPYREGLAQLAEFALARYY